MAENDEQGVAMTWKGVTVTTRAGRPLLRGVDGVALPGSMTALMGASGAGKTTLLNTLLVRNLKGLEVEGEIRVNGNELGKGIVSVSAYVQQEDLFVGTLTVGEHLHMQAKMRLPSSWSAEQQRERVEKVAREMLLEGSMKTRIGIAGVEKGISGGEMKRLAFATEILADPPILFCDEPTTGLDSHTTMLVVKQLDLLASQQNKTILCTIHQPASEVFEIFDKVLFLAGGRVAFYGSPAEAVTFFAFAGYRMPEHSNPADHFIQTLAILPGEQERCKKQCNEICDMFSKHALAARMNADISNFSAIFPLRTFPRAPWLILASSLFLRYFKDNTRRRSVLRAKFIQKVFMGLFIGLLYLQTETDQIGVRNTFGVLFYFCSELTYSTIFGIQSYMPGDFPLVAREYNDGVYPVSAYYTAKVASYVFLYSLDGMVMVVLSYFLIGLYASADRFLLTILAALLIELCAASVGVAICSAAPSYAIAVSVTGPLLTVLSVTGGLMSAVDELPSWISWIQYASWFRYGYEALIINHMTAPRYDSIPCDPGNNQTCIRRGQDVIDTLSFSTHNFVGNQVIMFLYTCCVYCLGYGALVFRVIRSR